MIQHHIRCLGLKWMAVLGWIFFVQGCGGGFGKVVSSPVTHDKRVEFLNENFENFKICYSGDRSKPGAIRFDLKNDDVTLTGKGWYPVENKDELNMLIGNMLTVYAKYKGIVGALGPQLYEVQDKNGKRIGYLLSATEKTVVRPDGQNYSIDPLDEVQVRNIVYPQNSPGRNSGRK